MSTAKQSNCSPKQLESLAKAREKALEKRKAEAPVNTDWKELKDLVISLKEDVAAQYAEEMRNIDTLRKQIEELKDLIPKKPDMSFLNKF